MIRWNNLEVAEFFLARWSESPTDGEGASIEFPLKEAIGELTVFQSKGQVQLRVRTANHAEPIAGWLCACDGIDVHADDDETPCIVFWLPSGEGNSASLGIYRKDKVYTIFTGVAQSFVYPLAESV